MTDIPDECEHSFRLSENARRIMYQGVHQWMSSVHVDWAKAGGVDELPDRVFEDGLNAITSTMLRTAEVPLDHANGETFVMLRLAVRDELRRDFEQFWCHLQ